MATIRAQRRADAEAFRETLEAAKDAVQEEHVPGGWSN